MVFYVVLLRLYFSWREKLSKIRRYFWIEPYVIFIKFWLLINFLVEYMITLSASSMFELFLLMSSCLVEKERERIGVEWCRRSLQQTIDQTWSFIMGLWSSAWRGLPDIQPRRGPTLDSRRESWYVVGWLHRGLLDCQIMMDYHELRLRSHSSRVQLTLCQKRLESITQNIIS